MNEANSQGFQASQQHIDEWVKGSAVNPKLVELNLVTIQGEDIFTRLYPKHKDNRLNGGRLNSQYLRYENNCQASSGWWFKNIDLETGEPTGWGQFKADSGCPLSHNGKTGDERESVKYRSPKGIPTEPIIVKVPQSYTKKLAKLYGIETEDSYWQLLLKNPDIPLFITEGAKKTASLISQGIPAIGIVGVHNWGIKDESGNKRLHPTIEKICKGREVFLCFDRDPVTLTKATVRKAVEKLAIVLKGAAKVYICYPPQNGLNKVGIDDFFVAGGTPKQLRRCAIAFEDWTNPFKSRNMLPALNRIRDVAGHRIKLNLRTSEIELDGKPINPNTFRITFCEQILDNPLGLERFQEIISAIAEQNAYDPVKEYLDSLPNNSLYDLETVAVNYFGCEPGSPQAKMTARWLISAVARTYDPGCKADCALILYEPVGGEGKSTFFETLAINSDFFCDDMGDINNKDERLKMHQHWIIEWGELDGIFGKKHSSLIKSFLSCKKDTIRPAYGKGHKKNLRRSIICGTTNQREILPEKSGERRYWIVEVKQTIDIKLLKAERDQIWAAAKQAYLEGQKWWFDKDEQQAVSEAIAGFHYEHPYKDEIEDFLADIQAKGLDRFPVRVIKDYINPNDHSPKFASLIKSYLETKGYYNEVYKNNLGKATRGYVRRVDTEVNVAYDTSSSVTKNSSVTSSNSSNSSSCRSFSENPSVTSLLPSVTHTEQEIQELGYRVTDDFNKSIVKVEKGDKPKKQGVEKKNNCNHVTNTQNLDREKVTLGFQELLSTVDNCNHENVVQNTNVLHKLPEVGQEFWLKENSQRRSTVDEVWPEFNRIRDVEGLGWNHDQIEWQGKWEDRGDD